MNFLDIGNNKLSLKATLLIMLAIYIFSIACRMIWVYQFGGIDTFMWNSELMINTNDGYFFAEGARDILANDYSDMRSPTYSLVSQVTAFFVKILPFSLETVILYMPAYLSSLIIIPIVFIGRTLGNSYLGFIAALIGSIVWSYYNRTMVGYYDTDMLNIVFPMFILLGFIQTIIYKNIKFLLVSLIFILGYSEWYTASYSLILALVVSFMLYLLFKNRKEKENFLYFSMLLIALANIFIWIKILILIGLYVAFYRYKEKLLNYVLYIFTLSLLVAIFTGSLNPILNNLRLYFFREAMAIDIENLQLHYFSVTQTVREAGKIPFEVFANRISGSEISFFISIIGYLLLIIRYPIMLLGIPMLGLGFLASSSGLRFTVYAVPIMALGFAYMLLLLGTILEKQIDNKLVKPLSIIIGVTLFLYPNIEHIIGYKVPTVFKKDEVHVLTELKKKASKDDYILTWWDYGYPLRFYTNMNTLVDGGLHSGDLNFPISFLLMNNQIAGANMARLDVEYTKKGGGSIIKNILQDYNMSNPNRFLESLSSLEFSLPKKTNDIYLYLPDRMLSIFPTVNLFSNLNLLTGKRKKQAFFYQTQYFKDNGTIVNLGNGVLFYKSNGKVKVGKNLVNLNKLITTEYTKDGKLNVKSKTFDPFSDLSLIYMKNYNRFILLDKKMLNSLFIQLYVLENYNQTLYEPVILTPFAKVFKLKI